MSDLQLLYTQLSRLDRDKEGTRTLLERIHRRGLNSSVDRLSELPRLVVGLSWDVSIRWREAVACYAYGQYNAAISVASEACEIQLRERLIKGTGAAPKGTYGQMLLLGRGEYDEFAKKHPGTLSRQVWELHKRMVKDYRNPHVHFNLDSLARKRKVSIAGPPDFTKFHRGLPRLRDPVERYYDMLALHLKESDPLESASECMKLAHAILEEAV
jgi:hypothetical protein